MGNGNKLNLANKRSYKITTRPAIAILYCRIELKEEHYKNNKVGHFRKSNT